MNEQEKNPVFHFWNNGETYRSNRPFLNIAIVPPLPGVYPEDITDAPAFSPTDKLRLKAVAMSYFDSDSKQRVFVINIPNQRPEIRFSLNFPFDKHFEDVLIGAIVDIISRENPELLNA
jgi:hypothetical protein